MLSVLFAAVVLIQTAAFCYLTSLKKQFFIDEIYSYILSNSYSADRIATAGFYDKWVNGEDLLPLAEVQEGERFAYGKTYYNNTLDAHPPFYYFLLHTVCSFFPNSYSKWLGIGLNLVLFVSSQIMLFLLSKKIFGTSVWAVIPPVLYGCSLYAVNTAILIRMYMLSTLLTVILTYLHYEFVFGKERPKRIYPWFFVTTFLGVFTHYFFALYAFFLAAATCIYLLVNKRFKRLFGYMAVMLGAVGLVFLVFPAGIKQITGSDTNNISGEVTRSIKAVSELPGHLKEYIRQIIEALFAGLLVYRKAVLLIICGSGAAAVLLGVINRKKNKWDGSRLKEPVIISLVLGGLLLFTLVLTAFLSGDFTFDRYLYNVIPVGCLFAALLVWCFVFLIRTDRNVIALGMICVACISLYTLVTGKYGAYLYPNSDFEQVIEDCRTRPVIMISEGNAFPTGNYEILSRCEHVYMSRDDDFDIKNVLSGVDTSGGICVMVFTDDYWGVKFDGEKILTEIADVSDKIDSYYQYGDCTLGEIYFAD